MALHITQEHRSVIKDEFLFNNPNLISAYIAIIGKYMQSQSNLAKKNSIMEIFHSVEKIEQIACDIIFTLATTEPGEKPIQSIAGQIAPCISVTDSMKDRTSAMQISMELLLMSKPIVQPLLSKNGHLMIESMISNQDLIMKNIVLPLERPTDEHKTLGSYNWELTETESLNLLNHTELVLLNIDDPEPHKPSEKTYDDSYLKEAELHNKWAVRQVLKKQYAGKTIYSNWASDYRGRMYSIGYYINPQGTELEKNMVGFANGEKLDFHGILQLKKSIASAYGLDKKPDKEKLQWFDRNKKVLHLRKAMAKEPHTFGILVKAWKNHLQGKKIHTPIELDATNSQSQMVSVLLHSNNIAEKSNVIPVEKNGEIIISDLYQEIADEMSDIIAEMGGKNGIN